jgi:hypothetical protein
LLSFPEQQSFSQPAAHFSPQLAEAFSIIFAQAFPSLPLQQEAASFAEQQEATSLPSFELDFACMQACLCSAELDVAAESALSQQAHLVSEDFSGVVDWAGADVCAQEAVASAKMRAISLYFMIVPLRV